MRRLRRPDYQPAILIFASASILAISLLGIQKVRGTTISFSNTRELSLGIAGASLAGLQGASTSLGRIRMDRRVYPEPLLPALPRAGGKFTDPTFGTLIMRATDEQDYRALGCGTWYSQWPTFNSNNTRLLIRCGVSGDMKIKAFDPVSFTLGSTLRTSPTLPGGVSLTWQGATWSRTDPDLIYVHVDGYNASYPATGMKLYTYRPSTNVFTLLKDFAPELARGKPDYLFEMHVAQSGKDDIFTFMQYRVGNANNPLYFIVWDRLKDKVLYHLSNEATQVRGNHNYDLNSGGPDKSGRYIVFSHNKTEPNSARHEVLDLQRNAWQTIYWTGADDAPSHGDVGTGTTTGRGNFSGGFNLRNLRDVHGTVTILFDNKDARGILDWTNDQHTSLYADDESWVLLGLYDDPAETGTETGAFENEIMQVAMDGSQRIRRLFHHRSHVDNFSDTTGYWAIPKPTISRDGRFIAFTSNWGKSGRYDLFIARIEPAEPLATMPAPTATPSPTPTPSPTAPPAPTPAPPPTPAMPQEMVWVEDALPTGAIVGNGESWNWVSSSPSAYSGAVASQSSFAVGLHQHYFWGASATMTVNRGEVLVAYVFLDPGNPPSQIMLEWVDNQGSWEHRAYWGSNNITWGANGTNSRRLMGPLPLVGGWTRLEVPASQVGLEGETVNGMAFTLYGGRATWDRAGKVTPSSPLSPGIFTLGGNGIGNAVALNAATLRSGEFNVMTPENFGPDKQTRVLIFASGLSNGVLNTNTNNNIAFGASIFPNLAESVVIEARTVDNRIFQLPVEFAGPSGRSYGLDQISVRLIGELSGAGSVELTLIIGGQRSNMAMIKIM